MVAQVTGLKPGEFIHTFGDAHIYLNHIEGAKEQIERDPNKYSLPQINTENFTSIFDWKAEDSEIINYKSYPRIKFNIAI